MADTTADTAVTCDWYDVPCATSKALDWAGDALLYAPRNWYAGLVDAAASMVESADVPAFVQDAQTQAEVISTLANAGYFLNLIAFQEGVTVVLAAMVLRYTWGWLPFFGR